jgi:hypothetical protein
MKSHFIGFAETKQNVYKTILNLSSRIKECISLPSPIFSLSLRGWVGSTSLFSPWPIPSSRLHKADLSEFFHNLSEKYIELPYHIKMHMLKLESVRAYEAAARGSAKGVFLKVSAL